MQHSGLQAHGKASLSAYVRQHKGRMRSRDLAEPPRKCFGTGMRMANTRPYCGRLFTGR